MDFSTGVQLSFELSRVFPVQKGIEVLSSQLLKYARDLYKSGCNIMVEEDLKNIFGRGKIVPDMENKFKSLVKVQKFTPLYNGCEIRLDSGPGPTMAQALRDSRELLATVIQLSFLGWTHSREQLAATLAQVMERRAVAGVPGALISPKSEDIAATLKACNSQSSAFAWSEYVNLICMKVRLTIPEYRHSNHHLRLSPALLAGALDYLYLAQQLPEDRIITVSNAIGFVTLTVWAHFLLGLTVHIISEGVEPVVFGAQEHAQVVIAWSHMEQPIEVYNQAMGSGKHEPSIRLLDKNMTVIFQSACNPEDWTWLTAEDRHPLSEYGAVYLYRAFNDGIITDDHDPVYKESVNLITALAIRISHSTERKFDPEHPEWEHFELASLDGWPGSKMKIETWRICDAAKQIFSRLTNCFDMTSVNNYLALLTLRPLEKGTIPNACYSFLEKIRAGDLDWLPDDQRYYDTVITMAYIIFVLAHVRNLHEYPELPILWVPDRLNLGREFNEFHASKLQKQLKLYSRSIFNQVLALVTTAWRCSTSSMLGEVSSPSPYPVLDPCCFLASDIGWSLYFDTVGEKDVFDVKPIFIRLKKGTPTHSVTGDQKSMLRDVEIRGQRPQADKSTILTPLQSGDVLPNPAAIASTKGHYWTIRSTTFDLIIKYRVEPTHQWPSSPGSSRNGFDHFIGYAGMFLDLWIVFRTPPCECDPQSRHRNPIVVYNDAVLVQKWSSLDNLRTRAEKTIVLVTRGDSRMRWLAVVNARKVSSGLPPDQWRYVMLGTRDCCDACALKLTNDVYTKWFLIL